MGHSALMVWAVPGGPGAPHSRCVFAGSAARPSLQERGSVSRVGVAPQRGARAPTHLCWAGRAGVVHTGVYWSEDRAGRVLTGVHWFGGAAGGGAHWGTLIWGHWMEGCSLGDTGPEMQPGGHLLGCTGLGLWPAGPSRGCTGPVAQPGGRSPGHTGLGRGALAGLYWSRGAAGRGLAGTYRAGGEGRGARWGAPGRGRSREGAGRGRAGPRGGRGEGAGGLAVAVGTHRGGQCRSAAPLRPAGPAGERECARGRPGAGPGPEAGPGPRPVPVPGGRRAAGPVR